MAPDFDFDLLSEMANAAPTAGFGPQQNFGKLIGAVSFVKWDASVSKFVERPFDNKPAKPGEWMRLTLTADLSEFNPALTGQYKRQVDIRKSSDKVKTDWSETVEPALIAVLGKDYWKKITKGVYAHWEDVDTVERNKEGKLKGFYKKDRETQEVTDVWLTNTTTKLLHVFKSKTECAAAREERFSKKDNDVETGNDDIPANVISEARGLITALGVEPAKQYLADTAPYNEYDLEALVTAANPL